jgi:hypothetical protein
MSSGILNKTPLRKLVLFPFSVETSALLGRIDGAKLKH